MIEKTLIGEDEGCYDAAAWTWQTRDARSYLQTALGMRSYVIEAAKEYPEVQFCHATGFQAAGSGLSNMHNYFTIYL